MLTTLQLGEREAALAITTIRDELVRRGKTAVIAVSDDHGELISLLRMDGAPMQSVQVATRKCLTAARERCPTLQVGRAFREKGWQLANSDPAFTGWGGGVPVFLHDQVVGAVAVSGLDELEDAELAELAARKIVDQADR